jgi:LuxR family maltose regulon positive regulatory protein
MAVMSPPVLWSKLRPPSSTVGFIERPRLVDSIVSSSVNLWLVMAPAGYGKTTLLAQACDRLGKPVAWMSVDHADNDPVRFWMHVTAAIGEAIGGVQPAGEALMNGDVSLAVDELIVAIEAVGRDVVLVLDDLYEVDDDAVLADLGRLVSRPPSGLTIAILSRAEPRLPLARLRSRGETLDLGPDDLAFTADEGRRALAADVESGLMSAELAEALVTRSEGWPAGLRLARLAVRGRPQHDAEVVAAVSGQSPGVAQYLAGEVLDGQPEDVRDFLLATSILDDLAPGACDAVTGRAGSLGVLRGLVADQVFTTLIDPDTSTFRYHRLLREFLRSRLAEGDSEDIAELHRRAATWFERNGEAFATIRHAVAAGERDRALAVLAGNYLDAANLGQIDQLWAMVDVIGPERVLLHPEVASMPAWASLNQRRFDEIEPWLESMALVENVSPEHQQNFDAQAAMVRSHRDRHLGLVGSALAHGEEAARIGEQLRGTFVYPNSFLVYGVMLMLTGDDRAAALLRRAIEEGQAIGETSSVVMAYSYLAGAVDDLEEAEAYADTVLSMVDTPELERFNKPVMAWLVRSQTALAGGRVGDAEDAAERALALAHAADERVLLALIEAQRARIFHLIGREEDRRAALRSADRLLESLEGADWVAEQVRAAHADTRFAPLDDAHLPPGARELTDREMAVLRLLPHGLSRRELSSQLFVSENTVKTHLTSIRRKLGLRGRDDVVGRARELGLLPDG